MGAFVDITGQRYGRLVAVKQNGYNKSGRILWLCKCDCGGSVTTSSNSLRRGHTRSCGCLSNESRASRAQAAGEARGKQILKHGQAGSRLYAIWKSMRQRCNNPNDRFYSDYGGRGISVCSEWDDFQAFQEFAMKNGYDPEAPFGECTLDRIDNSKGYNPTNCRFTTLTVQANNRRKRRKSCR